MKRVATACLLLQACGTSSGVGDPPWGLSAVTQGSEDGATAGEGVGEGDDAADGGDTGGAAVTSGVLTDAGDEVSSGEAPPDDEGTTGEDGAEGTTAADATEGSGESGSSTGEPLASGCTEVDFLFVIDDSYSMGTNQAELVASFPELVEEIETTLTEVESIHVGVVTTDAYADNQAGCNVLGALVTQTGGADSSASVCGPFASGERWMNEDDDLDTAFACAAAVGTDGSQHEQHADAAIDALSPALNAVGACNDGFNRPDALLVLVFITDEDDPGSSGIGSAGDPDAWHDDIVAAKESEDHVVVLTLTRGAPGNVCGGAVGAEVDGMRLMELAESFGDNGFIGDVCADSFGPFFAEAVEVIGDACDDVPPPGGDDPPPPPPGDDDPPPPPPPDDQPPG